MPGTKCNGCLETTTNKHLSLLELEEEEADAVCSFLRSSSKFQEQKTELNDVRICRRCVGHMMFVKRHSSGLDNSSETSRVYVKVPVMKGTVYACVWC